MFRRQLLSHVAVTGEYQSPNVCFIDDDDKEVPDGQDDEIEAGDEDESVAEDGDESDDEGEDGDEEDHGEETEDREARQQVDDKPRQRNEGVSAKIRREKAERKEAQSLAQEALRRAEAAERRAEAAERASAERRPPAETAEQRQARFAQMSPEERAEARIQEVEAANNARFNALQFQSWDSGDKAKFDRLVDRNPLYAKVEAKVAAEYDRLAKQGSPVSREILAKLQIGEMMVSRSASATTKQRKRAEAGVRRETVPARRVSSDAATSRSRRGQADTPEARRARLENVIL